MSETINYTSVKDKDSWPYSGSEDEREISSRDSLLERDVGLRGLPWFRHRSIRDRKSRCLRWQTASLVLNVVLLGLIGTLMIISASHRFVEFRFSKAGVEADIIRLTSEPSPIIDDIHISLMKRWRNGSFSGEVDPSVLYRREPSPEVDAIWQRLSNINPVPVSSETVEGLGYDSSKTAKFPLEFGFGPDAHVGRIEVFHQIHCLNWLRKELHFKHYFGDQFPDGEPNESHRAHQYHCLFILLEGAMCSSNVTPYLHFWTDAQDEPFPDFNNRHVCRNFDTILEWQEAHSVDQSLFVHNARRPADVEPIIMSHRFKKIQGLEDEAQS